MIKEITWMRPFRLEFFKNLIIIWEKERDATIVTYPIVRNHYNGNFFIFRRWTK